MAVQTAEEFLDNHRNRGLFATEELRLAALTLALEFAEAHRQECLQQVAKKARPQQVLTRNDPYYIVNKDSVLNAYSKKNIK